MKDYLVRGLVNSKNCRVFACQTTNLLEKARQEHDLWPTASAALGRMMSATLMMAAMNKNNEKMTVTINGGGPIGTMMAVTRGDGHIWKVDRKSTRLNSSHKVQSRMPSSA